MLETMRNQFGLHRRKHIVLSSSLALLTLCLVLGSFLITPKLVNNTSIDSPVNSDMGTTDFAPSNATSFIWGEEELINNEANGLYDLK
ncbi:MAG: hypothetical protein ACTSQB_02450, partial [Candidatus Heimdallarchaeota archaeon]